MSFGDGLVGFGNALPGVASQVIQTWQATRALDKQKADDQAKRDDQVLKLFETSEDPNLRSLAVIGRMRQTQPDYKPGPKGLVNDLLGKQIHEHPEWEQLHRATQITEALKQAHPEKPMAAPMAPPMAPPPPAPGGPDTPEGGSELGLMPGAGGAPPPPEPPPMLAPTGPSFGSPMPGTTYGMPQGSMVTPDNQSASMMPPPPPTGGPVMPGGPVTPAPPPPAAPAPPSAAAGMAGPATPPVSPMNGVHPELQQMLKDAASGSAVSDVKAAADETGKAFGTDVLGGFGARGDAAFKAGAGDRIGRKQALQVTAQQAAAKDKEAAATARSIQSAKDALERVQLRSDAAMERMKEHEKLVRSRPDKARQAPQINTQKEMVDIERDGLKDKASVQKEIDHQLITLRAEAQKNFTNPAQLAQLEDQVKRMGEERIALIDRNVEQATKLLGNLTTKAVTKGAPKPLESKVDKPGGGGGGAPSAKAAPRKVTRDASGNLVLQ